MPSITDDITKLLNSPAIEKLEVIERRTRERLNSLLNVSETPSKFDSIIYEVVLKRFNRIGQEGMISYSQEGLTMAFPDSDFSEYEKQINDYLNEEKEVQYKKLRGKARFV